MKITNLDCELMDLAKNVIESLRYTAGEDVFNKTVTLDGDEYSVALHQLNEFLAKMEKTNE